MSMRFLSSVCLCVAAAMSSYGVLPVHDTKTPENVNKMQIKLAKDLSAKAKCINHGGAKKFQEKVGKSQYSNYWNSWSFSGSTDKSPLYLKVDYLDSAKMYAVHKNKALVSKLSPREWDALRNAEQRLATLQVDGMSDFDKVLTIHDALLEQVEYDIKKYTATDMLLTDKGRCDSYSRTMQLMLQMVGIPAMRVIGMGKNEAHAWNLVKLGNDWYHIDATWNDPKGKKGESIVRHHYFLLSDAEMKKDHQWEDGVYPITSNQKAYFFKETKTYFENYASFWKAVKKAYAANEEAFEGYLTCYKNEKNFENQLQEFCRNHTDVNIRSWSGPDDKEGAVYLVFRKGSKKEKAKKHDYEYPVENQESAKDWLGPEILQRLYQSLGNPAALQQGVQETVEKLLPKPSERKLPSYFF